MASCGNEGQEKSTLADLIHLEWVFFKKIKHDEVVVGAALVIKENSMLEILGGALGEAYISSAHVSELSKKFLLRQQGIIAVE